MAMIREAPSLTTLSPAKPIAPSPQTAEVVVGETLAVLIAAPYPVGIAHPIKQIFSSGAAELILQS